MSVSDKLDELDDLITSQYNNFTICRSKYLLSQILLVVISEKYKITPEDFERAVKTVFEEFAGEKYAFIQDAIIEFRTENKGIFDESG